MKLKTGAHPLVDKLTWEYLLIVQIVRHNVYFVSMEYGFFAIEIDVHWKTWKRFFSCPLLLTAMCSPNGSKACVLPCVVISLCQHRYLLKIERTLWKAEKNMS